MEVTLLVTMLGAALSAARRSIVTLAALFCVVHLCQARASYTLIPTIEGTQLRTPQGRIVFEYKTKIPANLQSPSAAYFDPVNTPSGERVSNAAPDDHPWRRGIFPGILNSEFRTSIEIQNDWLVGVAVLDHPGSGGCGYHCAALFRKAFSMKQSPDRIGGCKKSGS